jgi:hypothetical protein
MASAVPTTAVAGVADAASKRLLPADREGFLLQGGVVADVFLVDGRVSVTGSWIVETYTGDATVSILCTACIGTDTARTAAFTQTQATAPVTPDVFWVSDVQYVPSAFAPDPTLISSSDPGATCSIVFGNKGTIAVADDATFSCKPGISAAALVSVQTDRTAVFSQSVTITTAALVSDTVSIASDEIFQTGAVTSSPNERNSGPVSVGVNLSIRTGTGSYSLISIANSMESSGSFTVGRTFSVIATATQSAFLDINHGLTSALAAHTGQVSVGAILLIDMGTAVTQQILIGTRSTFTIGSSNSDTAGGLQIVAGTDSTTFSSIQWGSPASTSCGTFSVAGPVSLLMSPQGSNIVDMTQDCQYHFTSKCLHACCRTAA